MRSSAPHSTRLDIQGLRAIAVLAVVANHLTGQPGGGFVGVDIFFVISGFVITLGMLRRHEETGSLSFKDFYFRRVARILPAATLAIIATVTAGYFAFFAERANGILADGLWAFFAAANWRFALTGTDYWAEGAPVSPLQHYWSLGVEEQFYFVWPLVFFIVLAVAARLGAGAKVRRSVLAGVLVTLGALSFIWAMTDTQNNAPWAYFSTLSRAWELAVGALLAVMAPSFARIPQYGRNILGWTGIAGIVVSVALIAKTFAFPAPWAALPVFATALVIIAGTENVVPGFGFLTNKASSYVGNASYSLYLWHFPVIIIVGALWPAGDPFYYPAMLLIMGCLAVLSYELVELPVQSLLTTWRKNGFARPIWTRKSNNYFVASEKIAYMGLAALATAALVVTPLALHKMSPTEVSAVAPIAKPSASMATTGPKTSTDVLSEQINAALATQAWPALSPSLDNVLAEGKPDEDSAGCGQTDLSKPSCVFGTDKAETVVVLGDSTGITLLPTVRAALGEKYNVRGMTKAGCVTLDVSVKDDRPEMAAECEAFKEGAIAEINRIQPAIVFLSNTSGVLGQLTSGTSESQAGPEWQRGTERMLAAIRPSGAQLFVVTAPPSGKPPATCATRTSAPAECIYRLPQSFIVSAAASLAAAKTSGARIIDTRGWFCSGDGYCPAFVGMTPVKRDGVHTTKQYAATLVPVFKDALDAKP